MFNSKKVLYNSSKPHGCLIGDYIIFFFPRQLSKLVLLCFITVRNRMWFETLLGYTYIYGKWNWFRLEKCLLFDVVFMLLFIYCIISSVLLFLPSVLLNTSFLGSYAIFNFKAVSVLAILTQEICDDLSKFKLDVF